MEKKKMAMVSDMMRALTNLFATRKGAESSYSDATRDRFLLHF